MVQASRGHLIAAFPVRVTQPPAQRTRPAGRRCPDADPDYGHCHRHDGQFRPPSFQLQREGM